MSTPTRDHAAIDLAKGGHRPLIPDLIGTREDGHDQTRSLLALDWIVRTWLPTWLQLAHLDDEARALRDLAQIVDIDTATAAGPIVRDAQAKAREKRPAAWAAAGAAAGAAARDAAGAAAWDAARDAARDHLRPTVTELQRSAIDLYRRMIDPAGGR